MSLTIKEYVVEFVVVNTEVGPFVMTYLGHRRALPSSTLIIKLYLLFTKFFV